MAEGGSGHADTINSYPTRSASLHQPDGMVTQVREACTTELAQLIRRSCKLLNPMATITIVAPTIVTVIAINDTVVVLAN